LDHHTTLLTPRIAPVSSDEIQRQLAWRDSHITFLGKKLAEVASELNRYNVSQVEITDSTLAELPIGGTFSPKT
jgi:ferric-dicitrate binding protein FerR (iron transport regulator)